MGGDALVFFHASLDHSSPGFRAVVGGLFATGFRPEGAHDHSGCGDDRGIKFHTIFGDDHNPGGHDKPCQHHDYEG